MLSGGELFIIGLNIIIPIAVIIVVIYLLFTILRRLNDVNVRLRRIEERLNDNKQ